jgi:hypothetical protein
MRRLFHHLLVRLSALSAAGFSLSGAPVDFSREVLPLLSDKCFHCHGPDEKGRKAGLRLDTQEGAFAPRKDGQPSVIVAGKSAESELVRRLVSSDPDDLMPPPDANRTLTPQQKDTLKRWVDEGGKWGKHWAFEPIQPTPLPEIANRKSQIANPLDAFVRARLEKEGLQPAPEATPETLIRRVAFDLTGLPPTPAEVDAFVQSWNKSPSPEARDATLSAVIDRALASPAYGERMALEWMDLARYADTYGYQADVERDMSPWRDWVIRAFNDNLPYDQFITWQLAGDLLPDATRDQVLATAFNRLHRQTNEGGSIEEEWRTEYVADRVHTMGTAFLSLTLECSRCHDHKYDPISQRDYYSLFAFFNSIDESGLYSHFTQATPTPTMLLYGDGAEEKHRELKRQISESEAVLAKTAKEGEVRFQQWLKQGQANNLPQPVAAFGFETIATNQSVSSIGKAVAKLSDNPESVTGRVGQALQFSGDNSVTIEGAGDFKRTDEFSFDLWLNPTEKQDRAVVFHFSRAWSDSGSRGYELVLDHGRPFFALIHFWPGNAIAVRATEPLPLNAWTRLTITYDGSSRADGIALYRNGQPLTVEIVRDHLYKDIGHRKEWGDSEAGGIRLTLAGRFRDNGFKNGLLDEFKVFDTRLTPAEVSLLAGPFTSLAPGAARPATDLATYLARHDEPYRAARAELKRLHEAENDLVNGIRELMVMRELSKPRETHLLKRGAYDAPGEVVQPGTPERIFAFQSDLPRNRLGLARWMTDPHNPLTARVAVNRIWKLHFGRGLVATVEDFGVQGRAPTHPDLLDWLARRFIESGWDRKALHKLILLSATCRQSSVASPDSAARDPDNLLLSRGPKHRLAAELIRDEALAVSGLLVPQVGGPSVKPYQPAGVWEEAGTGKTYTPDKGDKLYRRSLYTFWRRTAPPPSMLTFDATSREVCTAKREPTATPLQALVLLNDPQFLEAARVLAEQLVRTHGENVSARVNDAFHRLAGRPPQPREREVLTKLFEEQIARFRADPTAADKYLAIGERARDAALAAADVAATAVLTSTIMNHDEFVTKR